MNSVNTNDLEFHCQPFNALNLEQLYGILHLRSAVFVVEQNCPYQDIDGKDFDAQHFWITLSNKMIAYARFFEEGDTMILGRILTIPDLRNQGLGKILMHEVLNEISQNHSGKTIQISAQAHLLEFYSGFGFFTKGGEYLEDGIPHILMERQLNS